MRMYLEINEEEAKNLIDYAGFSANDSAHDLVKKIKKVVEHKNETIHIVWSYEDVIERAKETGCKVPSKERAIEILREMEHRHDCNYGITWDTLDCYLESKDRLPGDRED